MRNQRGFSLIELLIVVVIIAVVAAIAIPNFISARRAANEGSAASALRTLYGANVGYAATVGQGNYAGTAGSADASSFADLAAANLVDAVLGTGSKSGFSFIGDRTDAQPGQPPTFYFAANPSIPSGILMSGTKRYGIANEGVIRYDATAANLATPFDAVTLPAALPINP